MYNGSELLFSRHPHTRVHTLRELEGLRDPTSCETMFVSGTGRRRCRRSGLAGSVPLCKRGKRV